MLGLEGMAFAWRTRSPYYYSSASASFASGWLVYTKNYLASEFSRIMGFCFLGGKRWDTSLDINISCFRLNTSIYTYIHTSSAFTVSSIDYSLFVIYRAATLENDLSRAREAARLPFVCTWRVAQATGGCAEWPPSSSPGVQSLASVWLSSGVGASTRPTLRPSKTFAWLALRAPRLRLAQCGEVNV
jgi:hypothetical protein